MVFEKDKPYNNDINEIKEGLIPDDPTINMLNSC